MVPSGQIVAFATIVGVTTTVLTLAYNVYKDRVQTKRSDVEISAWKDATNSVIGENGSIVFSLLVIFTNHGQRDATFTSEKVNRLTIRGESEWQLRGAEADADAFAIGPIDKHRIPPGRSLEGEIRFVYSYREELVDSIIEGNEAKVSVSVSVSDNEGQYTVEYCDTIDLRPVEIL